MDIVDKNRLVEEIQTAFRDVPMPSDIGMYLEKLENRQRGDVKPVEYRPIADELHWFTPEGFCYFLPSILEAVILYPVDADVMTISILRALSPSYQSGINYEQFESRVYRLDTKQKKAIRLFIEHYELLFPNDRWDYASFDIVNLSHAITFWQQF